MKTKSLIIFFLGISLSGFSQYDFKKGFIVIGTDTTHGFIDNTNPSTNLNYCFFKKDTLDDVIKYTPAEIDAYGIYNLKFFVKKTVTLEDVRQSVFLEYLFDGIVDLYFCSTSKADFYFIEKDNVLYPLTNEDVKIELRGNQMVKESKSYIGILNWLMSDASEMRSDIYSSKLTHSSLIDLSRDYHNMVSKDKECIVYYKRQKKMNDAKWHVDAGVVADYIVGSIDMDLSLINTAYLVSNDFGNSQIKQKLVDRFITTSTNSQFKSFISGLAPGFYLNFNRNSRFSFEVQLKYQYLKNSQVQVDKIQIPFFMTYDFMRYTKAIPYMIIGLGNDLYAGFKGVKPLYTNYNYLTDITFDVANLDIIPVYTPNVIRYKQEHIVNKKYHPSILAGMGLSYELPNHKKVKLEIIGSYSQIKNNHYVDIHSETKITSLSFSCKYEL